ncbi:hypothetical protein Nepgr_027059 [Nepenthes gracilis]|uniref:Uncharacterized protein n=1 Tax=Nepenthes gracilis TaxID=150966 RepID=A0AAD3Y363_NEPGR|nr:hypothetical protein Nepgr_027059 [Nepenthes gracilis]
MANKEDIPIVTLEEANDHLLESPHLLTGKDKALIEVSMIAVFSAPKGHVIPLSLSWGSELWLSMLAPKAKAALLVSLLVLRLL